MLQLIYWSRVLLFDLNLWVVLLLIGLTNFEGVYMSSCFTKGPQHDL